MDKILSFLHVLFLEQLRNLHKAAIDLFSHTLKNDINDKLEFSEFMQSARKTSTSYYDKFSNSSNPTASGWNYDDYKDAFHRELDELTHQRREDQLCKVIQLAEVKTSNNVLEIFIFQADGAAYRSVQGLQPLIVD